MEEYQSILSHMVKDLGGLVTSDIKGQSKYMYIRDLNLELERLTTQFSSLATITCASGTRKYKY